MTDVSKGGATQTPLTFLHLSDIHLREEELNSSVDLDQDLRREVVLDVMNEVLPTVRRIDGVLVTGDIAFAGKASEFTSAVDWLASLCDQVGCPRDAVWAVPGNHDADRSAIKKSQILQDLHAMIREAADPAEALRRRVADRQACEALLTPLAEFNRAFAPFGTATQPDSIHWSFDLLLNDGSTLRLHGLNSVLTSDDKDNEHANRLVLGTWQVQLPREPHVTHLTLCHHPPDWLLDRDVVQNYLTARASLQLFGHKHVQQARQIDASVVIGAGALHPERNEPQWLPRYNVLQLQV
ncbi:MAG: metallophosphoesterase [Planctomycetota bacterium]|nr:metallophosphoesterase [Planctomycetota bacterium]